MKSFLRCGLVSLAIAASDAAAQAPANATSRLAEITNQFQTAYDRDVAKPHAAAVGDLDNKYASAVKRALDTAAQASQLEEALKLREEVQRVASKGSLPPLDLESLPDSLKQLRAAYRTALAKLEADRAAKAQPYFDHVDKLLETLQTEMTKENLLAEALAVKTKREELQNARAAVIPTAAPDATAAATPGAAPPKAPAAEAVEIPQGASQDTVIAWVFKYGGEVTVRANKRNFRATSAKDLPPAPYELTEIIVRTGKLTDKELAQLAAVPGLQRLESHYGTEITSLKPLAGLSQLRFLWIETAIKEAEFKHLAGLPNLQLLDIPFKGDATGEGVAFLRGHEKLNNLRLYYGTLTLAGAKAIASLPKLKVLELNYLIEAKNQKSLAPIGGMANLESLSLIKCQLEPEAFAAIAPLKKLHTLTIGGGVIDNRGFGFLSPCAPVLKRLNIGWEANLSDEGVKHIAAALPNLEQISIPEGATCTAAALRELAKLSKLNKIVWSAPGLKDKDCLLLAKLPVIEEITLRDTAITDEGLAHLQAIASLKEVTLMGAKVTAASLAAFRQARPDVKVTK